MCNPGMLTTVVFLNLAECFNAFLHFQSCENPPDQTSSPRLCRFLRFCYSTALFPFASVTARLTLLKRTLHCAPSVFVIAHSCACDRELHCTSALCFTEQIRNHFQDNDRGLSISYNILWHLNGGEKKEKTPLQPLTYDIVSDASPTVLCNCLFFHYSNNGYLFQ